MSYSISITKRTNGGYTVVADEVTSYPSQITYHGTEDGVIIQSPCLHLIRFYRPDEWTIQSATGYSTVTEVADALDALGVLPEDTLEDIESLLTTIDTDTGAMATSLAVLDDWDESDRAKVNLIAGQAGIDAASGSMSAKTPRFTLATDDPAVTSLAILDEWDDSNYCNVNLNIAGTDVAGGTGDSTAQTLRVAIATDDVNTAKMVTALEIMDDWDDGNYCNVNLNIAGTDVAGGTGDSTAQTLRVVLATDQAQLTNDLKVTLDSEKVSIASGDLVWNHYTAVAVASTGQDVTTSWANVGGEIDVSLYDTLNAWVKITHTSSTDDRIRVIGRHTSSGDDFVLPIKAVASTEVKVTDHYYEFDSDATQNMVLDFDVTAVPIALFQIQCSASGATADIMAISYTLK